MLIKRFCGGGHGGDVFRLNCSFSIANLALKREVFKFKMLKAKFNMLNDPVPHALGPEAIKKNA